MGKRRVVLCGASSRGYSQYAQSLTRDPELQAKNELVGVYDLNPGRARYVAEQCGGVPAYETFDQMMQTAKPDFLIVATQDDSHVDYCIRGLAYGVDVFCEKPMAVTAEQVRKLREAEIKYGRRIRQCFNVRFDPSMVMLKKLIDSGVLGEIYNVHYEYLLTANTVKQDGHGASYYHRWNRYMDKSGGLLVTKATHHFDSINWLIGQRPLRVSAFGKLRRYGKNGPFRSERCLGCPYASQCEFYTDIDRGETGRYFHSTEIYDGYHRDGCVFAEDIDIYDTMSLIVEYDGGTTMSYSETSAGMYEGYKLNFNGSKGRIEASVFQQGGLKPDEHPSFIRFIDTLGNVTEYEKPKNQGEGHASADDLLNRVLFLDEDPELPSQKADSTDGAYSVLIGAAGNVSIREGRTVSIDELIGDPELLKR